MTAIRSNPIRVSVIVPVYNAEKYIEKCCSSILNQSIYDIELILVNDGSTDNSLEMCKKIQSSDARVQFFTIENSGGGQARNFGMSKAKGEFIAFVDADDLVHEDIYKILLIDSENYDIVMCNYFDVYKGKSEIKTNIPLFLTAAPIYGQDVFDIVYKCYLEANINFGLIPVWNKLYRRSLLVENEITFDQKLHKAEDYWFNFECFKICKSFKVKEEALYYYNRDVSGSLVKAYRGNWLTQLITSYEKLYNNPELRKPEKFDSEQYLTLFARNVIYNILLGSKSNISTIELKSIITNEFVIKTLRVLLKSNKNIFKDKTLAVILLYMPVSFQRKVFKVATLFLK